MSIVTNHSNTLEDSGQCFTGSTMEEPNGIKQSSLDLISDQVLGKQEYMDDELEYDSDDRDSLNSNSKNGHKFTNSDSNTTKKVSSYSGDAFSNGNTGDNSHHSENDRNDHDLSFGVQRSDCSSDDTRYDNSVNDAKQATKPQSDEPEQLRKLFIGGLDYKTTEETLKQHFQRFGEVLDCVVMRDSQSKRSRGFGFIIYSSSCMVDRAQNSRPHDVDGREVQSKRAVSREDSGKPEAQATVKKVYLGGLSEDVEESELRDYFKDFGNIVNINILLHKETGKRRGFAFIEYDDYDPVDKIVLQKYHTIKDKRIEAKKAIPKNEMDARKRVDPRAAMAANAMLALSTPPINIPGVSSGRQRGRNGAAGLWDAGHYGPNGYPAGYPSHIGLEGYPPHYHSHSAHYATGDWLVHGGQSIPYNIRGSHGASAYSRNGYSGQTGGWPMDYSNFSMSQGGTGPVRVGHQHRGWAPYGSGYGTHRGRGYNPQ